jgi:DNA polymerase-3 subunit alpha
MTIEKSFQGNPEFASWYKSDSETKEIVDAALGIEGIVRQDSIHAAGVVISPQELTNFSPLKKGDKGEIITHFAMDDIKKIGLLKMDFLGLRTIDVIKRTLELVKATARVEVDVSTIPLNDDRTFKLLRDASTVGVFQLGETGMRALLKELGPTKFTDIIALVALFRPGPLGSGMHKEFVARKHGRKKIQYSHKSLEHILKETYGIIVYQEQVMQIAAEMAGYTMAEADILRKAMGKKIPQILKEQKKKFIEGAVEKSVPKQTAEKIFSLIEHFGEYGFNKSHSAAYAMIAYQTAYLKANYPVQYMAALLSIESESKDKVTKYVHECRRLGIKVLPPDVNESLSDFTVSNETIRFGLSAVRNIGEALVEKIINARKTGPFLDLFDFCARIDSRSLNKRTVESLIKAGAFDSFGFTRNALLCGCQKAMDTSAQYQKEAFSGQFNLFGRDENSKVVNERIENLPEMEKDKLLAEEKAMLGIYITDHPLLGLEEILRQNSSCPISDLKEMKDGSAQIISGMISKITWKPTKNGSKMAYIQIEDLESAIEAIVFPNVASEKIDLLVEDMLVTVKGKLDIKEDEIKMVVQQIKKLDKKPNHIGQVDDKNKEACPREEKKNNDKSNSILKLRLPAKKSSIDTMGNLKEILKNYKGTSRVVVEIPINGKSVTLKLGEAFSVNIDDLLVKELQKILSDGNIVVLGGER